MIETLLVLLVLMLMGLVLVFNILPEHEKKVIEGFLQELEKDSLYAQQYAIVNVTPVYILFNNDQHQYEIRTGVDTTLKERKYPSTISIEDYSLGRYVYFNRSGTIQKSGTLLVYFRNTKYKVIYYLGKGRVKIEKL